VGQIVGLPPLGAIIESIFATLKHMENTENILPEEPLAGSEAQETETPSPSELELTMAELNECKDKHLRLVAEFENFKRRNAKERVELTQTAGKEIIQSLLDVLDDCDRAQKQLESTETDTALKEGVMLVSISSAVPCNIGG